MKKRHGQMSEAFLTAALLSASGGLQDAYTYIARGEVFANAQTGNIVLLSQNLFSANWGRVLCAMGYSGADFDQGKVDVAFSSEKGSIDVFLQGVPLAFDEERALEILREDVIHIDIDMHAGVCAAKAWGCDLTKEYVAINGDYRS